ncbi:MAG: hypothetical protein KatS3mg124_1168 [Porticoccaceae bacterium]|nr:MAG: hypothetical protein KatS3mg124_1168 [Porticoccaceae bacterium]
MAVDGVKGAQAERVARILRRLRGAAAVGLLLVAGVGFWEHREGMRFSETTTGTVVALTRAEYSGAGRGDSTPPRIEYQVAGRAYSLVRPRAVFDLFRFDEIGEPVPLRYDPRHPEQAVVDLPWYRYPVTGTLGLLVAMFLGAVLWFNTVGRHSLEVGLERRERLAKRYHTLPSAGSNRRRILAGLHRYLAALMLIPIPLLLFGVFQRDPWPAIAAFAIAIWLGRRLRAVARCPHCGASLFEAIQPGAPAGHHPLWLRDLLAGGKPLECASCGRELDSLSSNRPADESSVPGAPPPQVRAPSQKRSRQARR